jgi:hypothetical protein
MRKLVICLPRHIARSMVIKQRKIRCAGHIARKEDKKNASLGVEGVEETNMKKHARVGEY